MAKQEKPMSTERNLTLLTWLMLLNLLNTMKMGKELRLTLAMKLKEVQ